MRVLVTEDDDDLRVAVEAALRGAGFAVDAAADLTDADEALTVNAYDCAVFDRMLPAGDALDYLALRRGAGWWVPVLFLTARDTVADRVAGLNHGDDYLVKPFEMLELITRVRSLCRRANPVPESSEVLRWQDIVLDPGTREASRAGRAMNLTAKEYAVLRTLLREAGGAVSRTELIAVAWDEVVAPASNVLDVLIAQLRRKLGSPTVLHTVRGHGYQLGGNRRGFRPD